MGQSVERVHMMNANLYEKTHDAVICFLVRAIEKI